MKNSGIYKIQSKVKPERIYVGSAVNITHRWNCHLSDLRKNIHCSSKLQNHYNKYGKNDLQFSVLIGCDKNNLLANEQFFLDSYKPYFNTCKIAGSNIGCKWPEEMKRKISKSLKGNIPWNKGKKGCFSKETIRKMIKTKTGKEVSEETRRKMSLCHNGSHRTEETKERMSKSQMGNKKGIGNKSNEGRAPWNKGKFNMYSKDTIKKMVEGRRNAMAVKKSLIQMNLN